MVGIGAALGPLDFAVNVAFPAITAAFSLPSGGIRWVAIVYVLVYGCLLLAAGRLGDAIGHRRVFRAGLALAALAFSLCALAPTYTALLAARVLQGAAVAMLLASGPALVTSLYPEARRTWALGAYGSIAAAAGVAAPLIGGSAIAALGWAGVYWFRVPVALGALLCLRWAPAQPLPRSRPRFDAVGAGFIAAGIALLLLAPALLDVQLTAAALAAPAGAAAMLLAARRRRAGEAPLIARATLADPRFFLPNLGSATIHLTSFTIPLVSPYYFVRIAGYDAVAMGAILAIWALGALAGSLAAARVVAALGVRPATFLGGVLMTAGLALMVAWPRSPWLALMLGTFVVHGAGIGLFQVAYTDLVVASLPRGDRGVAGGLANLTRTVGLVVGAAAFSALLRTVEARQIAAGADDAAAFHAGFHAVFVAAAIVIGAFFALTAVLPGVWLRGTGR